MRTSVSDRIIWWDAAATLFRGTVRLVATSLLFPLVAMGLQYLLWPAIRPFAWFLSYPAVFFSSRAGGMRAGLIATGFCTAVEWWFFIPPAHTFAKDEPRYVIPALTFVFMGVLFSVFHQRLRTSLRRTASALSERERSMAALARSEATLCNAQTIAQLGSWDLDLVASRLECSDELYRIFGRSPGEPLTWMEMRKAIDPGDRPRVDEAWNRALHGKSYDLEYRILNEVRLRWVREIGRVEMDGEGRAVRANGTVQDITRRRIAQARMDQIYRANRALSKCNQALIRAAEEQALLQRICEIVVQDAGYPLCWVGRAEQDESRSVRVLAQAGWRTGYLSGIRISWADTERGRGPTGACIRTRQIVSARNIATDPTMAPWRKEALSYGYGSSLAIPIVVEAHMYGALTIYAPEADAFGDAEIALLEELASDLAFGISTLRTKAQRAAAEEKLHALNTDLEARVLARTTELQQAREQEGEIGHRIQQTLLLDQPPRHMPSLRVSALSIPTERIDGDFYAFIEAQEGSLDIIVGDVMGKGVPAALLGAATKTELLKAVGRLTMAAGSAGIPQPEAIVMQAHTEIVKKLIELESFVTLCYARIDTRAAQMQFVDCGHTGILHYHHGTCQADILHGDHVPLGVREEEVYAQRSVVLEGGDLVVFFSDGITEARNPHGEFFGIGRLLETICASPDLAPNEIIEAVRTRVTDFCACDRPGDDLTIVAVRMEQVGAPMAHAEMTISSRLQQLQKLRNFVNFFCDRLMPPVFGEDAVRELALAANEVASNIMKHAYQGREDRLIAVEGEAWPDRISICLRHRGALFVPPDPVPPPESSRESGFGLYMLSRLVDEVHYYRDSEGKSCIALVKRPDTAVRGRCHGDPG